MVGFVLIVIIMAIVFLVFMGVWIRSPSDSGGYESKDIYMFLESGMEVTTQCAIGYVPNYVSLGELIKKCYEGGSMCLEGGNPCDVLDNEVKEILEASYKIGQDRPIKGYNFLVSYNSNSTQIAEDAILEISEGECKGIFKGAEYLIPSYPGTIVSSFKLCS